MCISKEKGSHLYCSLCCIPSHFLVKSLKSAAGLDSANSNRICYILFFTLIWPPPPHFPSEPTFARDSSRVASRCPIPLMVAKISWQTLLAWFLVAEKEDILVSISRLSLVIGTVRCLARHDHSSHFISVQGPLSFSIKSVGTESSLCCCIVLEKVSSGPAPVSDDETVLHVSLHCCALNLVLDLYSGVHIHFMA